MKPSWRASSVCTKPASIASAATKSSGCSIRPVAIRCGKPAIIENARVYWAACLLGAGDADASDAPLRAAIHENPQMKPPDSLVFPQPVVDHFLKVRDSLVTEIRAAEQARIKQAQTEARLRQQSLAKDRERLRTLEQLARQETLIFRNRRGFALVPFGVGQFQNREAGLGYTLLVSEVLAGGLCLTSVAWQSRMAAQADEQREPRAQSQRSQADARSGDLGHAQARVGLDFPRHRGGGRGPSRNRLRARVSRDAHPSGAAVGRAQADRGLGRALLRFERRRRHATRPLLKYEFNGEAGRDFSCAIGWVDASSAR
jgi:hypothetical protein